MPSRLVILSLFYHIAFHVILVWAEIFSQSTCRLVPWTYIFTFLSISNSFSVLENLCSALFEFIIYIYILENAITILDSVGALSQIRLLFHLAARIKMNYNCINNTRTRDSVALLSKGIGLCRHSARHKIWHAFWNRKLCAQNRSLWKDWSELQPPSSTRVARRRLCLIWSTYSKKRIKGFHQSWRWLWKIHLRGM